MGPERHIVYVGMDQVQHLLLYLENYAPTHAKLISELKESNKCSEKMKDEIGQLKKMIREEKK